MIPTAHVLIAAPALAPITGHDDRAVATRELARALAAAGHQVTVCLPVDDDSTIAGHGLARRLEPFASGGVELTIHEGGLEGGDVAVVGLGAASGTTTAALLGRAATELVGARRREPDVIVAFASTADALASAGLAGPRVLLLNTADELEGRAVTDRDASLVVLPSRGAADAARDDRDGPLAAVREHIVGIAPGIDGRRWNPRYGTAALATPYDPESDDSRRAAKIALLAELGLPARPATPLIGILGPCPTLTRSAAESLLELGATYATFEAGPTAEAMASRRPSQVMSRRASDEDRDVAQRIAAGADLVLVGDDTPGPLSRMGFLRYGTAPIAPRTGEWAERLVEFDPASSTGSAFLYDPASPGSLAAAVARAARCIDHGAARDALARRAIAVDTSWETSVLRLTEHLG